MLMVITGGSGSGKSEYAEDLAVSLSKTRVYIATMMVYDEEGKKRVERHRAMREDKNFYTLECPVNLASAAGHKRLGGAAVLLECMSNLVANEMFAAENNSLPAEGIADKIIQDAEQVMEHCSHLVVVTNEVFSDGNTYDQETESYIRALGEVNVRLAAMADQMAEVVCGIPVFCPDGGGGSEKAGVRPAKAAIKKEVTAT